MRYHPEAVKSLLDRLTDGDPDCPADIACSSRSSVKSLIDSVLRDLENLFNTRSFRALNPHRGLAPQVPVPLVSHLQYSILGYGSRDFSLENPRSHRVQQAIRLEIIRLLECFEPRLKDVTVSLGPAQGERALNFRIEALLQVEAVALPTAFDTHFDINSGSYTILS
ncbi:type VI secretion system baseplate subunit TssE [Geomonas nitrogeniifigens]|uniref:type VI secretion system baseplate subunit TssE n=1 Tax=Geomonas diazotrophica TaxID=2843197 RepID=UPI001C2C4A78|nr:type VI secretion system baseplate subunit TssE [Geomonas nitrogeniifigens]QXE87777.1 type VI secretion system baseplate subunit TssE [Geomonas nitrogeniifigens]